MSRGVALNLFSQHHYTDHLGPLCIELNLPYLFIDDACYESACKYYPKLHAIRLPSENYLWDELVDAYDYFLLSDYWDRQLFHKNLAPFEQRHNKQMRQVHCPHGFSDKSYYFAHAIHEDILLYYGQNMLDLITRYQPKNQANAFVRMGNYRYDYYLNNKEFYDTLAQKELFGRYADPQQPTLLYAPTWMDSQDASTFFTAAPQLLQNLPSEINLLIKVHPNIERDFAAEYYSLLGSHEERPNVLFVSDFPPIYPMLNGCQFYLGDISAIGYDFLTFRRPMYFLRKDDAEPTQDRRHFLHQCGRSLRDTDAASVYRLIKEDLKATPSSFKTIQDQVYAYTFGSAITPQELGLEIQNALK